MGKLLCSSILLVILGAGFSNGLKTPHHQNLEDALTNSDNHTSSLEWHDLNYWLSESYENSYEDDDYPSSEEHITIGTVSKNETRHTSAEHKMDKEDVHAKDATAEVKQPQDHNTTASIPKSDASHPKNMNMSSRSPQNPKGDFVWEDDEKDSDDGFEKTLSSNSSKNLELPSDNDKDAEKYFNPELYEDRFRLHAIEDILNRQWTVNYPDTNLPCIMLRGDIKLIVPVDPTRYNKDVVEIEVPQDAEASGTCLSLNNDYQEIMLRWNNTGTNKTYTNTVYFGFATNWQSEFSDLSIPADKYALIAVTVAYYNGEIAAYIGQGDQRSNQVSEDNADKGLASYSVNDLMEFVTPINHSMSCYRGKNLILRSIELSFTNIQLEAFRPNIETLTPDEFSTSVLCDLDEEIVLDGLLTFIIYFWVGALLMVIAIFALLLVLGYRRRRVLQDDGFGYKILTA